jgi:hypothetical protein
MAVSWLALGAIGLSVFAAPVPVTIGVTVLGALASQRLASDFRLEGDVATGYLLEAQHAFHTIRRGIHQDIDQILANTFWNAEHREHFYNVGRGQGFLLARALRVLGADPLATFVTLCENLHVTQPGNPLLQNLYERLQAHDAPLPLYLEAIFHPDCPIRNEYTETRTLIEILDAVYFTSAIRQRDVIRSHFAEYVLAVENGA